MSKKARTSRDAMEDDDAMDALKEMKNEMDEEEGEDEEKTEDEEKEEDKENISVADARKLRDRILALERNAEEMRETIRTLKARVDECEHVTNFVKRGGKFRRLSVGEKARLKADRPPVPPAFVVPFEFDSMSVRVIPFYPTYYKDLPSGTVSGKTTYIDLSNDDD